MDGLVLQNGGGDLLVQVVLVDDLGVGDEVQLIAMGEQLLVVAQGLTAENLTGSGGSVGIGLDHMLDGADVVVGGAQECAVDVAAGAAEADDGDVQFLHVLSPFTFAAGPQLGNIIAEASMRNN